jgi:hypothetical protein
MTTSTISSVPKLCDNCQQIDLSNFLPCADLEFSDASGRYGEKDRTMKTYYRGSDGSLIDEDLLCHDAPEYWLELDLGPLEAIVKRQEACSLCHFITTMFKEFYRREVSNLTAVLGDEGPCKISLSRFNFGTMDNEYQNLPYEFGGLDSWEINYMDFSCSSKGKMENHVAFLAAPTSNSASEPTFLARYLPSRCDVTLFNSWLQMCATSHSQCCRKPDVATVPLRLIDVFNMCLVIIPSQQKADVEYFTLSYVWGGGPKEFVLTSENLPKYRRLQGLPTLPKTISDAVTLTKKMGCRYLWVDSICIISNDPEDKLSQIPAMTSVYGSAKLTIIAAAGEDADHGLPGLGMSRPLYNMADSGRYQIVQSHLSPDHRSIEKTAWATRAWTYQELLLSPRSLLFFDTHVEWLCKRTEWHEELNCEHLNLNFRGAYSNREPYLSLSVSNYEIFVHEYTKRNLTFETDIVNAFAGIMAAIDDEIFWGVPHSRFGWFLAWKAEKVPSKNISDQRRNCDFSIPSWSWLSWRGTIIFQDDFPIFQSILAVYRWRSGQLERICIPEVTSLCAELHGDSRRAHVIWRNHADWTVRIDHLPSDVTLNENQLIFWAPTLAHSTQDAYSYVMIGCNAFGTVLALTIMWSDKIASRLGLIRVNLGDHGHFERAPKKLIIME